MKASVLAGVVLLALAAAGGASAAQSNDDVVILSVVPRSPDVKPFFMSVPADGHSEKAAQPNLKPAAFEAKAEKRLADAGKLQSQNPSAKD